MRRQEEMRRAGDKWTDVHAHVHECFIPSLAEAPRLQQEGDENRGVKNSTIFTRT